MCLDICCMLLQVIALVNGMKLLVQSSFDRCLKSSSITKELHKCVDFEDKIDLTTAVLQNLYRCKQYQTIATFKPKNAVESYLVCDSMRRCNLPLKETIDYIKTEIIIHDCDFLRLLYATLCKDISILYDIKKTNVTYTWEYWIVLCSLVESVDDFTKFKNHPWVPLGIAFAVVTRNFKIESIDALLKSLYTWQTCFPSMLIYILNLMNGIALESEEIFKSPYLSSFADILANEFSKLEDTSSVQTLAMQLSLEDPTHPNTKVAQAVYYSSKSMNLKSIQLLTSSTEDKMSSLAYLLLGHEYFQFGNYKKAVNCYLKVTKLNNKDVRGWAAIADTYFSMNLFNQAIRYYIECTFIYNKDAYVYSQLGCCFGKLNNFKKCYDNVLISWNLCPSPETCLALYKAAKQSGLASIKVFDILKSAFIEYPDALEFNLLLELVEHAIEYDEIVLAKQVFETAQLKAGWMNQNKLKSIYNRLDMPNKSIDNTKSPIRYEPVMNNDELMDSSLCLETPTRHPSRFTHYELGS